MLLSCASRARSAAADAVRAAVHVPTTGTAASGATYALTDDFARGVMVGVQAGNDHLELSDAQATLPFIWVPNSDTATVSKVDVRTGRELARYRVSPHTYANPSRTTVDQYGNCWVACRQSGTAVKIGLFEAGQYEDRNHNGIIDTCIDLDGDGDLLRLDPTTDTIAPKATCGRSIATTSSSTGSIPPTTRSPCPSNWGAAATMATVT